MFKMISPPFLKKGDKIGIVAPARKISRQELAKPIEIIEDNGYEVVCSDELFAIDNQFAGSDNVRASDLQKMLDDPYIKAVFFARGGYGSVRIIDRVDFTNFIKSPKWLVGYSDITVFHNHIVRNYNIQTLHGSMPINFVSNTSESLLSLFKALEGNPHNITFKTHLLNRSRPVQGNVVGGNLSVLYSLLGSNSFPDTDGKILFIEDLDEYLYHIDRMMMGFRRAGKLEKLAGLIVGGMSDMNDNIVPFGRTAEEIIHHIVMDYNYPVFFGLPAGHVDNNMAIIMGRDISIENNNNGSHILKWL